jgi:hypothetical protein
MKLINTAKSEQEILLSVSKDADKKVVQSSITKKGEACVVHLCGCNCGC